MTEAEKKAKKKYLAKGKRLTIDFYPSEADLIEHVEKQPKKQTYIKNLIRADKEKKNKTVYVVLWGQDCEGADVQAVFSNEKDAIAYLDEHYPKWERISPTYRHEMYESNGKLVKGCESASVEEWDVE